MIFYMAVFGVLAWVMLIVWVAEMLSPTKKAIVAAPIALSGDTDEIEASSDDGPRRSFSVPRGYSNSEWFRGEWERKYWMNLPGPFYSTVDNSLVSPVASDAPSYVTVGGMDGEEFQFIWRQPEYEFEMKRCLTAMSNDDTASYQIDGNQRWTPELVREWWRREKERLIEWAEQELEKVLSERDTKFYSVEREGLLHVYLRFMQQDAEGYLRKYVYFLESGKAPQAGDTLPEL